jgi:uncharacterized protein (TIGR02270 family)
MYAHIIERHIDDAAFLWELRDRAAGSLSCRRAELASLDHRIEAHLDALRIAGDPGWKLLRDRYAWSEPGELFAAAEVALESRELGRFADLLNRIGRDRLLARGVLSALGWAPWDVVAEATDAMCEPDNPPELQALGIATLVMHNRDPGPAVDRGLRSAHPGWRVRALRAAAYRKRRELVDLVSISFTATDPDERYWAAFASALFGQHEAWRRLWDASQLAGTHRDRAIGLAIRLAPPSEAKRIEAWLRADPGRARSAVIATAISGDGEALPWLLERCHEPDHARLAAWAIGVITGIDLQEGHAEGNAPANFGNGPNDDPNNDTVTRDDDDDLPWPDPSALRQRCTERGFVAGTRYLGGGPLTRESLQRALAEGTTFVRWRAALELALLDPRTPMLETRRPSFR